MPVCPSCGDIYAATEFACPRCTGFADAPWRPTRAPLIPEIADEQPRRRPSGGIGVRTILVGIALLCGLGGLAFVGISALPALFRTTPPEPADWDAWRAEVREAIKGGGVDAAPELAPALRPLFDALGQATRAGDGRAIADLYDVQAMTRRAGLARFGGAGSEAGLRAGFARSQGKDPKEARWTRYDFRSIRRMADGSAVAIVFHHSEGFGVLKFRYWVSQRTGPWRIEDAEELSSGMRYSALIAAAATQMQGGARDLEADTATVTEAMRLAIAQDGAGARRKLALIKGPIALPQLEALRRVAHALVEIQDGAFAAALTHLDAAERANPDMPLLMMFRGVALNGSNQHEKAVPHLEAFRDLLGDDAPVNFQLGLAYQAVRRPKDAAVEYRKSLDLDPDQAAALLSLIRCIGDEDGREDVGERFAKLADPKAGFDYICSELEDDGDEAEALAILCAAMRKIDARHPPLAYYESLGHAHRREPEKAAARFTEALAMQRDAATREKWGRGFLAVLCATGRPEVAYAVLPDKKEGFVRIARHLHERGGRHSLVALCARHARFHPDEPTLPFYRAAGLLAADDPEGADAAFTAGMATKPDAEIVREFRADRVLARYQMGRPLDAYREIGPAKETFEQLAQLLASDGPEDLGGLAALHEKRFPGAPELAPVRCLLSAMRGKHEEAVKLFAAALADEGDKERAGRLTGAFLSEMRRQGRVLEAYRAAPDARQAFSVLTPDDDDELPDWMPALLAAHRERDPGDPELVLYDAGLLRQKKDRAGEAALLEAALARAEGDERERIKGALVRALARAGRLPRAVALLGPSTALRHLGYQLHEDGKGGELLLLALACGPSPEALQAEGRAWLLLGRPARALEALRVLAKADEKRPWMAEQLAGDLALAGQAREANAALGGTSVLAIARRLQSAKRAADAAAFAEARLAEAPGDAGAHEALFEVYRARGDARRAGWHLRRIAGDTRPRMGHHEAWLAAANGRAAEHLAAHPEMFWVLTSACESSGDAGQLRALAMVERRLRPGPMRALIWEAKARALAGDHAGAARLIGSNRAVLGRPSSRREAAGLLVRALVKAGRGADAVREAEALDRRRILDGVALVLAHAAAGDADACLEVLGRPDHVGWLADACRRDPDLGPILGGERFAAVRAKYPPKPPRADDGP